MHPKISTRNFWMHDGFKIFPNIKCTQKFLQEIFGCISMMVLKFFPNMKTHPKISTRNFWMHFNDGFKIFPQYENAPKNFYKKFLDAFQWLQFHWCRPQSQALLQKRQQILLLHLQQLLQTLPRISQSQPFPSRRIQLQALQLPAHQLIQLQALQLPTHQLIQLQALQLPAHQLTSTLALQLSLLTCACLPHQQPQQLWAQPQPRQRQQLWVHVLRMERRLVLKALLQRGLVRACLYWSWLWSAKCWKNRVLV